MVNSLLDKISRSAKDGVITKWYNGKIGEIVDLQGNGVYRFIDYEVDSTGNAWIRPVTKEEQLACPIVASGIIAYWLRHRHEMYVSVLFESYSNLCLTTYKQAHGMDVDAWKRDLCREFTFEHHIPAEKKCIEQSKAISAYLTDSDNKTLQEVARNYLEFFREQQRKKLQSCYVKENQFIGPFLDFYLENSAARHCIVWLRTTYDMPLDWLQMQEYLDSKKVDSEDDIRKHNKEIQEIVKEGHELFLPLVSTHSKSKMMEEININLREKKTQEDRVQFLTYLLQPFIPYAYAFHPIAQIRTCENGIITMQQNEKQWREVIIPKYGPSSCPKEYFEANNKCIQSNKERIAYLEQVSARFKAFADHGRNQRSVPGENLLMCQCLATWYDAMVLFGCRLAALALTYGIDLNEVQQQCQIYLFPNYTPIHCVDEQFVFSEAHALQLLDEIKNSKEEQPKINIRPIQIVTLQPTQTEKAVIGKKDTSRTDCCFLYDNKEYFNETIMEFTDKLHQRGLVPEEDDYKDFMGLFGGRPCRKIFTWLGDNHILTHFIKRLCPDKEGERNVITTWPEGTSKWKVISQRFVDKEGKHLPDIRNETRRTRKEHIYQDLVSAFTGYLPKTGKPTT